MLEPPFDDGMSAYCFINKPQTIPERDLQQRQYHKYPYIFRWKNNPKRKELAGRKCRIVCRGSMNSCLVEFENGQQEVISRNALQRS